MDIGRFAPTTSGRAHPGTLLAGLLSALDARSRGGRWLVRLEDIDPAARDRAKQQGLLADLEWFGLEADQLIWQSTCRPAHEEALDALAAQDRLYACSCSRTRVKAAGLVSAAGGWVYPGSCRGRRVHDWRACRESLRVDLRGLHPVIADEAGPDLSQDLERVMGDPLVRRPDGSVTYQLAVVADDSTAGVTRVVRGRDLASNTATQSALYQLLRRPPPVYRHHLLLLEPQGAKLAKLHQSVGADQLRPVYSPAALRGFLAWVAGLVPTPEPVEFADLLAGFSWQNVATRDRGLAWDGQRLTALVQAEAPA